MRFSPKHRRDGNHKAIAQRLEELGCSVADTSQVGGSFPDLVVGLLGRDYLVEVKEVGKFLTDDQVKFHQNWRGEPPVTIWTEDQCVAWVNTIRRRVIDAFR